VQVQRGDSSAAAMIHSRQIGAIQRQLVLVVVILVRNAMENGHAALNCGGGRRQGGSMQLVWYCHYCRL
jgi:hypothetical protein